MMNVAFGAILTRKSDLWLSDNKTDKQYYDTFDKFKKDPVVLQTLNNTSDDLILIFQRTEGAHENELALQIKRTPEELPEPLKQYANPRRIMTVTDEDLFNPLRKDALQQRTNRFLLEHDGLLSEYDKSNYVQSNGFSAISGMDSLKKKFQLDVINPLRTPDLYLKFKLGIPNGVLLYGPPGCGKTYFAERLAEELGRPFFKLDMGDDSMGSAYIHQVSKNLTAFFKQAEKNKPCVLFIDEIESLLPKRGGLGNESNYKQEEITTLLKLMNEAGDRGILIIAASNQPELMDDAALRPGRLDKAIFVGPPDSKAREAALKYHLRGIAGSDQVDTLEIASMTDGYSQSAIKLLVKQACLLAVEANLSGIEAAKKGDGTDSNYEFVPISTEFLKKAAHNIKADVPPEKVQEYKKIMERAAA